MVFVRKVPGRSGATKVQVAERRAGRDVVLETTAQQAGLERKSVLAQLKSRHAGERIRRSSFSGETAAKALAQDHDSLATEILAQIEKKEKGR